MVIYFEYFGYLVGMADNFATYLDEVK